MQIKNNYDIYWEKREPTLEMGKGVFNGEYGTILNIDEVEKKVAQSAATFLGSQMDI